MKKVPYLELKQFLSTVFHPEWTVEHESADHAIKRWCRKADEKGRKAVAADIEALLTGLPEDAMENWVCEEARGDIFPPALGFTYTAWLTHVSEMVTPGRKPAKKKV